MQPYDTVWIDWPKNQRYQRVSDADTVDAIAVKIEVNKSDTLMMVPRAWVGVL